MSACQQPGVSIASVALDRGLNANLLRKWVQAAERGDAPIAIRPTEPSPMVDSTPEFMPVPLPSMPAESTIKIELRSGEKRWSVQWPASQAHECVLLLRALMK